VRFQRRQGLGELVTCTAHHQRVGEIVDVLGRAGEVDELGRALELAVAAYFLLEPVLDRLHVVIGCGLDRLHAQGVGFIEALREPGERGPGVIAEGTDALDECIGSELQQPADLDADPITHQAVLAEIAAQRVQLAR
jgi:hypothetical protein